MLRIMAGMTQRDSFRWFCWYCTSRCVPSCRLQARDAWHHGRFGPAGQLCGDIMAVACARLVLLVFSPRDEFPSVVCRPRCLVGRPAARLASWPVSTRRTSSRSSSTTTVASSRLVLLVTIHLVRVPFGLSGGPDALHHGWYWPEGQLRGANGPDCRKLRISAVAVHKDVDNSLSWCSGRFPWSL